MSVPRFTKKLVNQRILLIDETGGIGISVAQALLEYGAEIILSSAREAKLQQVILDLVRTIAAFFVAKIGINYIEKSRNSSIVFTSGSICKKPIEGGWSMLACIGASITGLTRKLAFDLTPIGVNTVVPGVIETDMWQGMGVDGKKAFFKQHEAGIPTGQIGQPEDLAEAYVCCLKDKNATEIVIHSNSGTFLQ